MSPLRLTIPMPPNMANARQHWRVKLKAKHDYWATLNYMHMAGAFQTPPFPTPARSSIHVRMFLGAAMDHDNAMARMKFALDWLVAMKYIRDDSPKALEWEGLPEQVVKRDGNYRIELTITPLSASPTP